MFQYTLNKLRVVFNNAFRVLLNEPRWCSASRLFTRYKIPSFSAVIRKNSCSLCKYCHNILVQTFYCLTYACYRLFLTVGATVF